jgi:hypothetical protein
LSPSPLPSMSRPGCIGQLSGGPIAIQGQPLLGLRYLTRPGPKNAAVAFGLARQSLFRTDSSLALVRFDVSRPSASLAVLVAGDQGYLHWDNSGYSLIVRSHDLRHSSFVMCVTLSQVSRQSWKSRSFVLPPPAAASVELVAVEGGDPLSFAFFRTGCDGAAV